MSVRDLEMLFWIEIATKISERKKTIHPCLGEGNLSLFFFMVDYSEHYKITNRLEKEPRIIRQPTLYDFDFDAVWAAMMDRLAQPLADGTESPFSSRNPLSAHGHLASMFAHFLDINAHEMNLKPDWTWIQEFRMLGLEVADSEYPVVNLVFRRSLNSIESNINVRIPLGTEIGSTKEPGLVAVTIVNAEFEGREETISVPARLNRIGRLNVDVQPGEFSILSRSFSHVESVANDLILYEGRDPESLSQAMLRARLQLQRGARIVTPRDCYTMAQELGAKKTNVLEGIQYGAPGRYGDLTTVVVYPDALVSIVDQVFQDQRMLGSRYDVRGAEVIPIDGEIDVRIVPQLSNGEAFNVAARTIQQFVNPPYGIWGDHGFGATVATALENQPDSIYAVPRLELKHAESGIPLQELDIQPWNLLEIQQSIRFNWLR